MATLRLKLLLTFAILSLPSLVTANASVPEKSNRVEIKIDDTPWKFIRQEEFPAAESPSFDDSAWEDIGVPHCFNAMDTFMNTNATAGKKSGVAKFANSHGMMAGMDGMYFGTASYRKHFHLPEIYRGRKVFIEFEGVNIACAVYINGHFMPTNSLVKQPGEVTHVFGFTPFVLDITPHVHFGSTENVLAVRVTNDTHANWYAFHSFGIGAPFGMGSGGIFRPVHLYITDPVHIPLNVYSNVNNWGTNLATLSATSASASVQIQTNVQNESTSTKEVTLETEAIDEAGRVVMDLKDQFTVLAGKTHMFDQKGNILNPHLWHPNDGSGAFEYMYRVYSIVQIHGTTVDVFESPLGIRTITWDENYPYINGVKCELYGFGCRYDYPALGTALPDEQHWRDIKICADCGGTLLRPGHDPSGSATVDACDYYGVAVAQPSGDNEFAFRQPTEDAKQYKREDLRDMVVRDRNHPSILFWEASNGGIAKDFLPELKNLSDEWDNLAPREISPRGTFNYPTTQKIFDAQPDMDVVKPIGACYDGVTTKNAYSNHPVWTAESWIASGSRFDWEGSIRKAEIYVKRVEVSKQAKIFGFAHWYLNETTGASGNPLSRALNCSAVDGNRIPELIYKIYENAVLVPYTVKPGIVLGSHWNMSGPVVVKAWSNCPKMRLYLNGKALGDRTPEPPSGDNPFRAFWRVNWESGTLKAVGLDENGKEICSDQVITAGEPDHIDLSLVTEVEKPDGTSFKIEANGSDAAFILAKVVDKDGNVCPTASNPITFNISGPGNYCGSWNQLVYPDKPPGFHSPGDHELYAEAGLIKVAVRSTFTPGDVTVTASSPYLKNGSTKFTTSPVDKE